MIFYITEHTPSPGAILRAVESARLNLSTNFVYQIQEEPKKIDQITLSPKTLTMRTPRALILFLHKNPYKRLTVTQEEYSEMRRIFDRDSNFLQDVPSEVFDRVNIKRGV